MEQYLKANGIPYARGGPASKRKHKDKKAKLKQTRLPATLAASPGSLKPRRPRPKQPRSDDANGTQEHDGLGSQPDVDSPQRAQEQVDKQQPIALSISDSASDAEVHENRIPSTQLRLNSLSPRPPSAGNASDKSEQALSPSRDKQHVKRVKRSRQSRINFPTGGERFLSSDPVDSEEEEFRGTQLAPKSKAHAKPPTSTKAIDLNSSSDESSIPPSPTSRRRQINISSGSDSEEDLVTPLRRRKRFMPQHQASSERGSPPVDRRSSQLMEARQEARDLDDNVIKVSEQRSGNTKKNNFRNNLERLRRKKAGLPSSSQEENFTSHHKQQHRLDNSSDDDNDEDVFEDAGEYRDHEDEDEQDNSDWIVDDGDCDRTALQDNLPEIFQQPRQPLEQFKIAIQWEILDLLVPQGGLTPDAYFKPAISWLRDRTVDGAQAAISSIWRRAYVRALRRAPDLNAVHSGNLGAYCDACGRTNRVATYVCKFEGRRYDQATLEDLSSEAESSEDDLLADNNDDDEEEETLSDEEDERARKERVLRREWNLGVNCYERTCVAHELFHLRKHLREEIAAKLQAMGHFSASKKMQRSVLSKSQKIELANQVTEQLDAARFQQRLWTQYRTTIEKNEGYIVDPSAGRKRKYVFS